MVFFSSPELKAQVSFSDQNMSVVHRCRCLRCRRWRCRKLLTFLSSYQNQCANSTKLGTKHPWVMRIQICSNEGLTLFQEEIITKKRKYIHKIYKSSPPEPINNHYVSSHSRILI